MMTQERLAFLRKDCMPVVAELIAEIDRLVGAEHEGHILVPRVTIENAYNRWLGYAHNMGMSGFGSLDKAMAALADCLKPPERK